ncbi:hypothetical protein ACFO3O_08915 [Dokdonia ponticola]|uniref:Uncharacterized protein n=1 Tax=Dokdonia ponticola TaxID=2041041 RepID=A0ABV9HX03_9FLAO
MRLFVMILLLSIRASIFTQDGSNIRYVSPKKLNNSYIGKTCHVDFGSRSFGGQTIDTIEIEVKGQKVRFVEHREDNGFNNWFRQQYLIALPLQETFSTRLITTKIDSLDSENIYVTSTVGYYRHEYALDTITIVHHRYLRKNVAKVLIED